MAVRAWGEEVLFLRSVVEEPANRSYGIEVARLAGLPAGVIARAREILDGLQSGHRDGSISRAGRTAATASGSTQMNLFAQAAGLVVNELQVLDLERLTPLDALNLLARWVAQLRARE
jgi:DNA mismatch repair protein MutS